MPEPFIAKFTKNDKHKTILVPNFFAGFNTICVSIFKKNGYIAKALPYANKDAIGLGKKYTHNDICFPAQINIGEIIKELKTGNYDQSKVAIALAQSCTSCRAGQYPTIARKALEDAGFCDVAILTTGKDTKNMHPGFDFGIKIQTTLILGVTILDKLEEIRHRIRPYEKNAGETNKVFYDEVEKIAVALEKNSKSALDIFKKSIKRFNELEINENIKRKKRILIVGEILLNFHETSNNRIEKYLEAHGMETILPSVVSFFKTAFLKVALILTGSASGGKIIEREKLPQKHSLIR